MKKHGRTVKEDWACSIMAQALMDIRRKADISVVFEKVSRTAIGVRPDLMNTFRELVKAKEKTL